MAPLLQALVVLLMLTVDMGLCRQAKLRSDHLLLEQR